MDRDPNRRPSTAGELLDSLQSALVSPNGSVESNRRIEPVARRTGIGAGVIVLLVVGVSEVAWLVAGSGMSVLTKGIHRLFGG